MLRALEIRNLLIIDHLELEFQPGLNVLTGETGAGKSILLDSLGFVLGWRGRAELVRAGAPQGEVTAEFELPEGHGALAELEDAGIPAEDGELLLRRVNTREGRKTAWINGRRASGDVLRRVSEHLVELHGQHDDRGLLDPKGHRALLDAFAQLEGQRDKVAGLWGAARKANRALQDAQDTLAALQAEEDFLRHAVAELDALDPQPGEDAQLDAARRQMQAAERVQSDIARAHEMLSANGAEAAVSEAARWLDGAATALDGQLDGALDAVGRAIEALGDAEAAVAAVLEGMAFEPHALETTEERLFAIRAMARKHDVASDALAELATELRARLEAIDGGAEGLAEQTRARDAAHAAWAEAAEALSAARKSAAQQLDKAMAAELAPLRMDRAVFTTTFAPAAAGPDGIDEVTFAVATNPGAPAGPLNKIASGGELSRFLLALKVCLTSKTGARTLIFDEIDRGVGGATADAVGRRLKALAEGGQVLVVTHSPQVAALGGHHWRVEKHVAEGQTLSTVVGLDPSARVDEIARMLAGDSITDAARDAARALLVG